LTIVLLSVDTYSTVVVGLPVGFPAQTGTATVTVSVVDINDNAPRFNHASYDARITENRRPGDIVARPSASDLDAGRNADIRFATFLWDCQHTESAYSGSLCTPSYFTVMVVLLEFGRSLSIVANADDSHEDKDFTGVCLCVCMSVFFTRYLKNQCS